MRILTPGLLLVMIINVGYLIHMQAFDITGWAKLNGTSLHFCL